MRVFEFCKSRRDKRLFIEMKFERTSGLFLYLFYINVCSVTNIHNEISFKFAICKIVFATKTKPNQKTVEVRDVQADYCGNHRFFSAGATSKKSCRNTVTLLNSPGQSLKWMKGT